MPANHTESEEIFGLPEHFANQTEPEQIFGLSEHFYVLLGQTIAAAGLVELDVYDLLTALDRAEQHVHAGCPLKQMIERCGKLLRRDNTFKFREEFVTKAKAALADVQATMGRRNVVVHNVWTFTRDNRVLGWRLAREGLRDPPPPPTSPDIPVAEYPIASQFWTESDLRSLFDELVRLHHRLRNLRDESEVSRLDIGPSGPCDDPGGDPLADGTPSG